MCNKLKKKIELRKVKMLKMGTDVENGDCVISITDIITLYPG